MASSKLRFSVDLILVIDIGYANCAVALSNFGCTKRRHEIVHANALAMPVQVLLILLCCKPLV